jgi:hypothetical protein
MLAAVRTVQNLVHSSVVSKILVLEMQYKKCNNACFCEHKTSLSLRDYVWGKKRKGEYFVV